MPTDIQITRIITRASNVALQLRRLQFSTYRPPAETWGPAINAVLYPDRLEICVDLAGVSLDAVEVSLGERELRIRGVRPPLDAKCKGTEGCRVLLLEIDDGPFERVLTLPEGLDTTSERITAREENGLLWIVVPAQS